MQYYCLCILMYQIPLEQGNSMLYCCHFLPAVSVRQLCTRVTHALQCANLGGPLHDHISTTYSLQRESILYSSKYFHVMEGLSPDIMHSKLEGCLQYETIKYLMQEQTLLSLDDLNSRIDNFPYCYADVTNKPMPIAATSLSSTGHSMKRSGQFIIFHNCFLYSF